MIAMLGAPGSGKSTLLQHLNGLLQPDEGQLRVMEVELSPGKQEKAPFLLRRKVGLMFQYPEQQLFEETVENDLRFGPLNFGATREEADRAVWLAAEAMHLDEEILKKSPFELSSGQMRKVAMAAVLAANPDIFVADEPTASLDPMSRDELLRLLSDLCSKLGKTVIIVTHRLEEVLGYADDYVVLSKGKVVFHGDESALLRSSSILQDAGLVVPSSIRLLSAVAASFGIAPEMQTRSPSEAAAWIASTLLSRGGAQR